MPGHDVDKVEFDEMLAHLEGKVYLSRTERIGYFKGACEFGKRILLIDDRTEVIEKFIELDREYHTRGDLEAQLSFFRLADRDGARVSDLIYLLNSGHEFDIIFIDGDLGDQGDGTALARKIRDLEGREYQPIALFTAQASFIKQHEASLGMRVIAKFASTGPESIQSIIIDADDIEASARDKFWVDARRHVLRRLDAGASVEDAANEFGKLLEKHLNVCAWYLREISEEGLCAIAKADDDIFNAGDCMLLSDTPDFQRKLLENEPGRTPWKRIDSLTSDDAGSKQEMVGYRVIAARLSSSIAGDTVALLTAYRTPDAPPFDDRDAMSLHHIAVTLRLALARRRTAERLGELSEPALFIQISGNGWCAPESRVESIC